MNSWKIILATVVIFGAGVVTGGLLVSYALHTPGNRRPGHPAELPAPHPELLNQKFVRQLDRSLHLTPEQRGQIEEIIAEGQRRNRDLWRKAAPAFRAVMQDVHQRIRGVLTPEQRKRFEELLRQFRAGARRPPAAPAPAPAPTNAPPE
ncbi:MAG: hypothetical protein KGJ60_15225 [Verrucomicrobiota bacterium]|nr:hypothetical protein [Verrucomicrobiota bacterium]